MCLHAQAKQYCFTLFLMAPYSQSPQPSHFLVALETKLDVCVCGQQDLWLVKGHFVPV